MTIGERIAKTVISVAMFAVAFGTFMLKVPMYPLIFGIAGCYFGYRACE